MVPIVISYSQQNQYDVQFAKQLRDWLASKDFEPWMVLPTIPQPTKREFQNAIDNSTVVLGIFSNNSFRDVNLRQQWQRAKHQNKLLILKIHSAELPRAWRGQPLFDFTQNKASTWSELINAIAIRVDPTRTAVFVRGMRRGDVFHMPENPRYPKILTPKSRRLWVRIIGVIAVLLVVGVLLYLMLTALQSVSDISNAQAARNAERFLNAALVDVDTAIEFVCPSQQDIIRSNLQAEQDAIPTGADAVIANVECTLISQNIIQCNIVRIDLPDNISHSMQLAFPVVGGLVCPNSIDL